MNFNQFILALQARRKAFLLVFAATAIGALLIGLIVPKKYVSTATVLIDIPSEQQMSDRGGFRERAGYVQTQIGLITSGRAGVQVARELKLAQRPKIREEWEKDTGGEGQIDTWIAQRLLKKLKTDTDGSNVLSLSFSSDDPRYSAEVANGFAKAYTSMSLDLRTEPQRAAASWFEQQLKGLRADVAGAQTKLASYQREKGIVLADERADIEATRLAELSAALSAARNATYEADSKWKQAADFAKNDATADSIPEVQASAVVGAIKADLRRAEGALDQMGNDLGPNHPTYQRQQAEATRLREKLNGEMQHIIGALGNVAQMAKRREAELKAAVAEQQQRMMGMKDARIELTTMVRDVENAQRTYDTALGRYLTNKIESRANAANVAILTPAIEPLEPSAPRVGLITVMGLVIGMLLAGGVVLLLEMLDRRIRSRDDLESSLAVPMLGRLSKWQPITGGRLMLAPVQPRALPHPW